MGNTFASTQGFVKRFLCSKACRSTLMTSSIVSSVLELALCETARQNFLVVVSVKKFEMLQIN